MKRFALLALLFSACASPKGHDTENLTAKLGNARSGVESATQANRSLSVNVARSRAISDRVSGKAQVIQSWLERYQSDKQP